MRPILKTKHKNSSSIKWATFVVFLIMLVSLYFGIKYPLKNQENRVILQLDNSFAAPLSSKESGFYSEAFPLSLSSSGGYKIFYTLNGTEPTIYSELYTKPIIFSEIKDMGIDLSNIPTSPRWKPPLAETHTAIILRAICVKGDQKKSSEIVRTFFFSQKQNNLPVFSLTVNADDFFAYKYGIYVMGKNYDDKRDYIKKNISLNLPWWDYPSNYKKRGDNSERPAHIEFFEGTGKPGFEANVGIRINGNATRGYSQKSLRVCMDEKYGMNQLDYFLFPENKVGSFNSFILRNGGNDWDKTLIRDGFMQSLLKNTSLDLQDYRPSIVFINGEYWGIHSIRERCDENYLVHKYKVAKDSLAILELGGNLFFGKKQDANDFKDLLQFVKENNLSNVTSYQYVESKIDLQSFMDFIIANVYFCNSDWPNNNVKFWRYKADLVKGDSLGFRDGRWRWMLYDTDWGFGYTGVNSVEMDLLERAKSIGSVGILFTALLKNKEFLQKFQDRFSYHLEHTFEKEHVFKQIETFETEINSEMPKHIDRWRAIGSYENWKSNVNELRNFQERRPAIQKKQLAEFIEKNKK